MNDIMDDTDVNEIENLFSSGQDDGFTNVEVNDTDIDFSEEDLDNFISNPTAILDKELDTIPEIEEASAFEDYDEEEDEELDDIQEDVESEELEEDELDEEDDDNSDDEEEVIVEEKESRSNKRIRELNAKYRAEQRRAQQLEESLEANKYQALKSQLTESQNRKAVVESQLEDKKRNFAVAYEMADAKLIADATAELQKTQMELMSLDAFIQRTPEPQKAVVTPRETTIEDQRYAVMDKLPDVGQDWIEKNDWFIANKQLTSAALTIAQDLATEGFTEQEADYYKELDVRMKEQFPKRFTKTTETKKEEPVKKSKPKISKGKKGIAPTKTKGVKKGKRSVRLSVHEQAIAREMGLSNKDYAESKKLTEGSTRTTTGYLELDV